jgi:hypothetical protein
VGRRGSEQVGSRPWLPRPLVRERLCVIGITDERPCSGRRQRPSRAQAADPRHDLRRGAHHPRSAAHGRLPGHLAGRSGHRSIHAHELNSASASRPAILAVIQPPERPCSFSHHKISHPCSAAQCGRRGRESARPCGSASVSAFRTEIRPRMPRQPSDIHGQSGRKVALCCADAGTDLTFSGARRDL